MIAWCKDSVCAVDSERIEQAKHHQSTLTKPLGSLGRLETIAEQFCGWQKTLKPALNNINIAIFAADHGVCQQNISAFPQFVTTQMINNFLDGGAAISVLSRSLAAELTVINLGIASTLPEDYKQHPRLINCPVAQGTADFSLQPAMTQEQLDSSLLVGRDYIMDLDKTHLFIGGEMGIGNTTAAAAIYAAALSLSPEQVVGPGTGLDHAGIERKKAVIAKGLALHLSCLDKPYELLRCLGGFEIAALVGSYIAAAQQGIPVLVDGFICTAAALMAVRFNPGVKQWLLFSHQSAEPAHRLVLTKMLAEPLLQLDLRLGEGSGAAVAVPLLQAALTLHNQMATFSQASVDKPVVDKPVVDKSSANKPSTNKPSLDQKCQ